MLGSIAEPDRVVSIEQYRSPSFPKELVDQFQQNFGVEFDIQKLRENLETKDIGRVAISTLRSFNAHEAVLSGERAVYRQALFTPRCEIDEDDFSEKADYELNVPDKDEDAQGLNIAVRISPRAIQVLHKPLSIIYEDSGMSTTSQVSLAYKAIFAGVVAQSVMKVAMRSDSAGFDERFIDKIDALYAEKFGEEAEDITDHAVRLNRIAMSLGGAVMLRQAARSIGGGNKSVGLEQPDITQRLKFFTLGLAASERRAVDQQQVSYALIHAYTPQEAARALRYWFTA